MIPGKYPLTGAMKIYRGDTFYGPLFTFPSFVSEDGPADLTGAEVEAEIRATPDAADPLVNFTVERVDDGARQVRLRLSSTETRSLPVTVRGKEPVWDIEIRKDGWVGTPLGGEVKIVAQVTR